MTQNLDNYGVYGVHGVRGVCLVYLHCRLVIQELNGVEGIGPTMGRAVIG